MLEELQRDHGLTVAIGCAAVGLDYRRYRRWLRCHAKTERYGGGKPGPRHAPHALLAAERKVIQALHGAEKYEDMSIRQVAVAASEAGEVEASPSSFQRVWAAQDPGPRRKAVDRPKPGKPEVTAERPNQVWSWDMTYIRLGFWFVYLFAIIDVHSRKIVGWHLSWRATVAAMKVAWDRALASEGLVGCLDAPQLPTALSDHGVQMKCKLALKFFLDLGIPQLFARCHVPTDNAWIESWFNIFKNSWLRFKDYTTFSELLAVVAGFVDFYNRKRVHGSIGMVTPEQMHSGQAPAILAQRRERRQAARAKRLLLNREAVAETDERLVA